MSQLLGRKDTRADEDRQRRLVRARDKGICQFEKLKGTFNGTPLWFPCGSKSGTDTEKLYADAGRPRAIVTIETLPATLDELRYEQARKGSAP